MRQAAATAVVVVVPLDVEVVLPSVERLAQRQSWPTSSLAQRGRQRMAAPGGQAARRRPAEPLARARARARAGLWRLSRSAGQSFSPQRPGPRWPQGLPAAGPGADPPRRWRSRASGRPAPTPDGSGSGAGPVAGPDPSPPPPPTAPARSSSSIRAQNATSLATIAPLASGPTGDRNELPRSGCRDQGRAGFL